jgi:formylglycine-generating enzyme required for sulfatase activity/serine/threonine protein kinase
MSTSIPALPVGFSVDGLRIDDVLGKGAFGITYRVTDEVIGATLALKEFFPAGLVSRTANGHVGPTDKDRGREFAAGLTRFLDEGRLAAPLKHGNIVQVFRCFEANGTAYMLMPWYQGEKLLALFERSGAFNADETRALALPLLDALAYLHQRDVVHQDIKPDNIYITENGEPILLDFGAATAGPNPESTGLGSEGYAAPEQTGRGGRIGPRTDIYGLAATLFRLVTGRIPPSAMDRAAAIRNGRGDPLPPVSTLAIHSLDDGLARAIDAGLILDPGKRPASANEWREQLKQPTPRSIPIATLSEFPREEREWLPLILLVVFGITITAAVLFLFLGGAADNTEPLAKPVTPKTSAAPVLTSEETDRWHEALTADTIYAYRRFLSDFPGSTHTSKAEAQLDILDDEIWATAETSHSLEGYLAYLDDFPEGLHESEASIRIDQFQRELAEAERQKEEQQKRDHQAWADTYAARSMTSVDDYLAAFPGGLHIEDALELKQQLQDVMKDQLAYEAARNINTIAAYQAYMDAYSRGRHVAAALTAIDDLTLRPGKTFSDCPDCPSMVVVPAGSFWQGSMDASLLALGNEKPRRRVAIPRPFAIGISEVTMAQWDHCVVDGGCETRPGDNGWGRQSRPVIMVSWSDALDYTDWLSKKTGQSYRLPSESEWEYAARAGEESDWLGGDPAQICEYGNVGGLETEFSWRHPDCDDGIALQTMPTGSFKANAFGLFDVTGNVAEWTLDCMTLSYLDAPTDGSAHGMGMCNSHMTRGGSWFTGTRDIRLPARFNLRAGDRNDFTGFRLVREIQP